MLRLRPMFVFLSSIIVSYIIAFFAGSMITITLACSFSLLAIIFFFFKKTRVLAKFVLLPSVLALLHFCLFYRFAYQPMEKLQGLEVEVYGKIITETTSGNSSDQMLIKPSKVLVDNKVYQPHGNILVYAVKGSMNYEVGSTVSCLGKTFKNKNDDFSIDFRLTQRQFLSMYATESKLLKTPQSNDVYALSATVRQKIIATYERIFSKDTSALITGITLGQTDKIDAELHRNFKASGVSHTLAVSGMHLAFVTTILYFVLALISKNLYIRAVLQIIFIWLFTALTGFSPSCCRAAIMLTLFQGGVLLRKEPDSLTSLSLAVMVCCLGNPFAVLNPSLALSATATLGILLLTGKLSSFFPKLKNPYNLIGKIYSFIKNTISMSVAATIGTLPIMLTMFQSISLLAPITNVLIVIVIEALFCIGFLAIVFSWLQPLCFLLNFIAEGLYKYCDVVTSAIARLPFCSVYTGSKTFWVVFPLLVVLSFVLWLLLYKKHPIRLAICYVAVFLCLLGCNFVTDYLGRDNIWVDYVDVGQGNCVVVSRAHTAFLIDCGGDGLGYQELQRCFDRRSIRNVSAVYITHLDTDHIKYLTPLLSSYRVQELLVPYREEYEEKSTELFDLASSRSTVLRKVNKDMSYNLEGLELEILTKHIIPSDKSENQKSLVYRLSYGPTELLFLGDVESNAEHRFVRVYKDKIESDVVMISHHGSASASKEDLLEYVNADVAVISVDKDNRYELPSLQALNRIKKYIPIIKRTDKDGTVSIQLNQNRYKIEGMK